MHSGGIIPEDAPDPRVESLALARRMPVSPLGLVPQRHLEDSDQLGVATSTSGDDVLDACDLSVSYRFWRNPDDHADPANLAELDEEERLALTVEPPWPRPEWLVETAHLLLYPMLWEAVRTWWSREPREPDLLAARVVTHVNNVLINRFAKTRGAGGERPYELDHPVDERSIERGVPVSVDGVDLDGVRLDTDIDVFGLGVALDDWTVLTAAIPRDLLPYLDVRFVTRPL